MFLARHSSADTILGGKPCNQLLMGTKTFVIAPSSNTVSLGDPRQKKMLGGRNNAALQGGTPVLLSVLFVRECTMDGKGGAGGSF